MWIQRSLRKQQQRDQGVLQPLLTDPHEHTLVLHDRYDSGDAPSPAPVAATPVLSSQDLHEAELGVTTKSSFTPITSRAKAYEAAYRRQRSWTRLLTTIACISWMTISSWAIIINRWLMVDYKFRYPITIAWMGLTTTTAASWLAVRTVIRPERRKGMGLRYYATRVAPTGFFMATTFLTGNMGYLHLSVAFVQMLKAFCPVVTMVLLFFARLEDPSASLVGAVSLIAIGVATASYGELNLSMFGLTAMIISVVAESIRLVMTQHLLVTAPEPRVKPVITATAVPAAEQAVGGGADGSWKVTEPDPERGSLGGSGESDPLLQADRSTTIHHRHHQHQAHHPTQPLTPQLGVTAAGDSGGGNSIGGSNSRQQAALSAGGGGSGGSVGHGNNSGGGSAAAAAADLQYHPLEGLLYISSACMCWLALQSALLEWPSIVRERAWQIAAKHPHAFVGAALAGFAVNLTALLVIKLASSLTLKVLGTVKDACLVAVGILFLHEAVSTLQLFGYSMSICGFITYNLIKAGVLQPDSGSIGKANGGSSSSGRGKGSGSGGLSGLITAVDSGSSSRGVMWRSSAGAAMQAGGHYGAAALKRLLPSKAQ